MLPTTTEFLPKSYGVADTGNNPTPAFLENFFEGKEYTQINVYVKNFHTGKEGYEERYFLKSDIDAFDPLLKKIAAKLGLGASIQTAPFEHFANYYQRCINGSQNAQFRFYSVQAREKLRTTLHELWKTDLMLKLKELWKVTEFDTTQWFLFSRFWYFVGCYLEENK